MWRKAGERNKHCGCLFRHRPRRKRQWRPSIPAPRSPSKPAAAAQSAAPAIDGRKAGVQAIGRGLIPPEGETGHSAKPNARFLWGKGRRPPPAGGVSGGQRPAAGQAGARRAVPPVTRVERRGMGSGD
ncbi:MAG: hypothetical protein MdMp014T_0696 [Treponematales bacterium]